MASISRRKLVRPLVAFVIVDILAVGAGMGVPIFAILLGFAVGWIAPTVLSAPGDEGLAVLRRSLIAACLTAGFTAALMLLIWGPTVRLLFGPARGLANFGIPMWLYEPRPSFIGWLVLMVIVSPVLQALTTGFAAAVRVAWRPPRIKDE